MTHGQQIKDSDIVKAGEQYVIETVHTGEMETTTSSETWEMREEADSAGCAELFRYYRIS